MKFKKNARMMLLLLIFVILVLIKVIRTQDCGWAHRVERFITEYEAMEGSWPWMVAISEMNRMGNFFHTCSGSMITSRHVLTVAYCFGTKEPSQYKVKIGHVDERLAKEYSISLIELHERYSGDAFHNIAILTLEKEVDSLNFYPICLPPSHEFGNVSRLFTAVVGWGSATSSGPNYPMLREKFGLEVISISSCNETMKQMKRNFNKMLPNRVTEEMICTAYPNDCIGEFGSPLMYQEEDQWHIIGLKSFESACHEPALPTGYTRVSKYLQWIKKGINSGCGLSRRMHESVGNEEAPQGSWPWMVAIMVRNSNGTYNLRCSGSLISNQHVLTAAQCFQSTDVSFYKARIGHVNHLLAQDYTISRIVKHEKFSSRHFDNNIAVLTLSIEVDSEAFIPVCLPPSREFVNLTGRLTALAGWVSHTEEKNSSKLKEKLNLNVISNSKCQEKFNKTLGFERQFPDGFKENIICTTYPSNSAELSGSPLMYQKEGRWYVVGLVSFGISGDPDILTGYTRVSEYLNWIKN